MAKDKDRTKPREPRRRPKQETLPGIELNVPEIDEAAAEYVMFRDARMANLVKEQAAGGKLLELMHQHKLKVYQYDGKDVLLEEIEKVRVRKKKAAKEEASE